MTARTATINPACCVGCTQCRLICPAGAIAQPRVQCEVDPARCTGCGRCYGVCPLRCIADADRVNSAQQ